MLTRDESLDAIAVIFARGGSKGLPKKNIRDFFGKPLIAWSIEHAMAVPRIRRIIVSTDSNEIASVAMAFGAEVPFIRPKSLASDTSSEWLAWQHALKFIESEEGRLPDALVTVPTTAPLRKPSDLNDCLDLYSQGDVDAVLTVTESRRNPCFNMVRVNDNQILTLFSPVEKHITRRQDAPKA
jgi:CMP-N-acetylneuraminic acid synthetase